MKLLHSADWHLGHRFFNHERQQEHDIVLNALEQIIETEQIDVLIIAGDIFDTGSPPNYAQKQYFEFLTKLQTSCCQHVVIIGGNHDSPAQLNAPKQLLSQLNIHIIGALDHNDKGANIEQLILPLTDRQGQLLCVIAAIPFLRDRDLHSSHLGQSNDQKRQQIHANIKDYYQQAAKLVKPYQKNNVPLIATGHLFAHGGSVSNSERDIHIGNLGDVSLDIFDPLFDYVALGHLHKKQQLSKQVHYSGSLLAMNFTKKIDNKSVNVIDFNQQPPLISAKTLPRPKALIRFQGTQASILEQIKQWQTEAQTTFTWVDACVTDPISFNLRPLFNDACEHKNMDILKISNLSISNDTKPLVEMRQLSDIKPEEIFIKCCEKQQISNDKQAQLLPLFNNLLIETLK